MIVEETFVRAALPRVYRAFADLDQWMRVLPDVLNVKMIYEDPCQQEFLMSVVRPLGVETVRGIRFLTPFRRIELFQPEPPPGFAEMSGVWTFEERAQGTLTRATRRYRTKPQAVSPESKLRAYLRRNLELFRDAVEGQS